MQDKKYTQSVHNKTPAMANHSWRFGDLSAAELLPLLQKYLTEQEANTNTTINWQLVWLNNDSHPIIGLLPKVSWSVYLNTNQKPSTLLESTEHQTRLYKVIKTYRDKQFSINANMSYADWQNELIVYSDAHHKANNFREKSLQLINILETKPRYQHGLIGFIGYDIAAYELSAKAKMLQATQPCAVLGHYDIYLTPVKINTSGDDGDKSWQLNTQISDVDINSGSENKVLSKLISYLNQLDEQLADKNNSNKPTYSLSSLLLSAQWQRNAYQQAFNQTQHYLLQGDCYQINLTQVWQGKLDFVDESSGTSGTNLIDYLPRLHQNTQAPFAGYLSVNNANNNAKYKASEHSKSADFELLSCSPELFFTFYRDSHTNTHYILTKPIKGTMPRGENTEQDLSLKQQLRTSDKDRSENVMIVDLLRNDLGKYAKVGSVKVPQLFDIESFSNVHHMVSTITAELKNEVHPLTVLFGSLPAGSITGTPKKRAVEIISELEIAARGAYCGTMGYMNFEGSGQWNVLIRTLQARDSTEGYKNVALWAGGGITIASECESEYQECLDKVGNLLTVLAQKD